MTALNAVAVMRPEENVLAAAVSDTAAIIHMIERAAKDPNVDMDKMERLLKVRDQIRAEQKEEAFNDAMAKAQAEMRPVAADLANPQTRSRYASAAALDRALRPIYTRHGFALSFNTEDGAPEGCIRLVCYVTNSGHTRTYRADMPADGKGAKGGDVMTKTHAFGSAATYGQRYLFKLIFNIAVGPDDDGKAAGGHGATGGTGELISSDQIDQIRSLIVDTGSDIPKFCAYMGVPAIGDIPADKAKGAIAVLQRKQALQRKEEAERARLAQDEQRKQQQEEDANGIPGFLDRRKAVGS